MQKKVVLSLVMLVSAGCLVAKLRSRSMEQAEQLQKSVASKIAALEADENKKGPECSESDNVECPESDCTKGSESDCTECQKSDDAEVVEKQEE